jgi:hypothetical protein
MVDLPQGLPNRDNALGDIGRSLRVIGVMHLRASVGPCHAEAHCRHPPQESTP